MAGEIDGLFVLCGGRPRPTPRRPDGASRAPAFAGASRGVGSATPASLVVSDLQCHGSPTSTSSEGLAGVFPTSPSVDDTTGWFARNLDPSIHR